MNALPLEELARRCGARLRGGSPAAVAAGISKDSRSLQPGELYLALRGERFDGHDFLNQAAAAGAAGAIVQAGCAVDAPAHLPLLEVGDPLAALHRLAASWRAELRARVICVTGSAGKTSTREFLAGVLAQAGRTRATSGNLNNHIGLPLSILAADQADQFAVWEIGMNHPGEIAPLARLAAPAVSVITNIGTAHIEFFANREGIAREKAELFAATSADGLAVFPAADDFAALIGGLAPCRTAAVGMFDGEPRASDLQPAADGIGFLLHAGGETHPVALSVPGAHMVQNALLAAAAGLHFGIPPARIATGLATVRPSGGRLHSRPIRGAVFLDDSYNANPESVEAALAALHAAPCRQGGRKIAVLGRMGELGGYAPTGYRRVGETSAHCCDILVTVGPETSPLAAAARSSGLRDVFEVPDRRAAAALLRSTVRPADTVLVKGSRAASMEEIFNLLD